MEKKYSICQKNEKKVMVGHLMLYHDAYISMKKQIKRGLIGKLGIFILIDYL